MEEDPPLPEKLQDASPPFDNPSADTIIRSLDRVHFHVHSVILSEASSILRSMRSESQTPETPDVQANTPPIIDLPEESWALDLLLRLCYPVADPVLNSLEEVEVILGAAVKYEMDQVIVLARRILVGFLESGADPLRIWAIAIRFLFEDDARAAANKVKSLLPAQTSPEELRHITAGDYYRLAQFHRAKGSVEDGFLFSKQPSLDEHPHPHADSPPPPDRGPDAFFDHPYTDTICRSSDAIEYAVHKIMLCMASPVLRDMITKATDDASPPATTRHTRAIVLDLPEDSRILGTLLKMCYPVEDADISIGHATFADVAQAAQKYHMDRVTETIGRIVDRLADAGPLQAYLAVARSGVPSLMVRAADRTMSHASLQEEYTAELEGAPADLYYRLLKYYDTRGTAVNRVSAKLKLTAYWDKASAADAESADALRQSCSCGGCMAWSGERKTCMESVKSWATSRAKDAVDAVAKCPEAYSVPQGGTMLLRSVQKGFWCSSCEQITSHFAQVDDYVQDEYAGAVAGIVY